MEDICEPSGCRASRLPASHSSLGDLPRAAFLAVPQLPAHLPPYCSRLPPPCTETIPHTLVCSDALAVPPAGQAENASSPWGPVPTQPPQPPAVRPPCEHCPGRGAPRGHSLCIHGTEALPVPRTVVIQPAGRSCHSHLSESHGGCLGIWSPRDKQQAPLPTFDPLSAT